MRTKPWWEMLELRPEIVTAAGQIDDVQMSLGEAVHTTDGATPPAYADASYYGDITEPTARLTALLADIAIRLAGGPAGYTKAGALTRLNQGMGGGKSHALVGAWHLATHSEGFLNTDIGRAVAEAAEAKLGHPLAAGMNNPTIVVLDLDNSTPGVGRKEVDGPFAKTLYEKFLWRLFDGDAKHFTQYREHWNDKAKIKDALALQERPVLIVIDEIMDYIGNGLTGANDPALSAQDMAFLRALLDSVNDVPNVAALVAMIDPEKDRISLGADGKSRQGDLHSLLERNGTSGTVNEDTDFGAILKRRLFADAPTAIAATDTANIYATVMKDPAWARVFGALNADWVTDWTQNATRSYPFHPQLMHLAEQEWAKNSGYQNVRSTIRVFAATIFALQERAQAGGWAPLLIGPGDLPLSNNEVREALLGSGLISDMSVEANYRSIIQGDITNLADSAEASGQARALDNSITSSEIWGAANPHAHERAATMIAVASLMPRGSGRRGASDPEIKVASALPDITYGVGDADGVIQRLTDINSEQSMASVERIDGKGGQPPRYHLNPETGAKVVYRQHRQSIVPKDRDEKIANRIRRKLMSSGPFDKIEFIDSDRDLPTDQDRSDQAVTTLLNAGTDDARKNRLFILDPAGFSLRNGMGEATQDAINKVSGLGANAATVTWASSSVFAVVNTQRRRAVREAASDYLAWQRTYGSPELAGNESARETAKKGMSEAETALDKHIKRAYQHILYLTQTDPDSPRQIRELTLDNDAETALNGATVWKELAQQGKAFESAQFSAKALLTNLIDGDYNKPLSELRDAFYHTPRLPLLPNASAALAAAIYDAVRSGELRLVGGDGEEKSIGAPSEINLSSQGLRLAKPVAKEPCDRCGKTKCDGTCGTQRLSTCPKCGKSDCDGTCLCPNCGKRTCAGNCHSPIEKKLAEIKINLMGEVGALEGSQLADLMYTLFAALTKEQVNYVQATMHMIVTEGQAETIKEAAESAGGTASIKPKV